MAEFDSRRNGISISCLLKESEISVQTHCFFFLEESDKLSRDFFSLLKFAFGCTPFGLANPTVAPKTIFSKQFRPGFDISQAANIPKSQFRIFRYTSLCPEYHHVADKRAANERIGRVIYVGGAEPDAAGVGGGI